MVLAEWPALCERVLQKRRNESKKNKQTERAILVIPIQLNLYPNQLMKNILMVRMLQLQVEIRFSLALSIVIFSSFLIYFYYLIL